MFVVPKPFIEQSIKNFIDNKSFPKVISSERAVIPFYEWFRTPKGKLAYIKS